MGDQAERPKLIDFLYRDVSRIDSFFAQLFQGYLTEIAASKTLSTVEKEDLGADLRIFKFGYGKDEETSDQVTTRTNPHDQRILDLLAQLRIPTYDSSLESTTDGQIVLVKGHISIRNYQAIKDALPTLADLGYLDTDSKAKISKDERKKGREFIKSMLRLIPMGLELEVETTTGDVAIGPLKVEYLTEQPDDLLRRYGNCIPGEWYVLGITDSLTSRSQPQVLSDMNPDLRQSVDQFANIIKALYSRSTISRSILPILVYRELNYSG